MNQLTRIRRWALLLPMLLLASACATAVGAAAGAAAAIAYNERNASTDLNASVSQVVATTEAVFQEMGVELTNRSSAADGTSAELRGMHEGANVTVEISSNSPNSASVTVTAREGDLGYRPSQAGRILQRIIDRS